MSKKYVMANINIPIQINIDENNRLTPLTEYVKISISNCDNLPEKSSNSFTLMEQINKMFSNNEPSIIEDSVLFSNIDDGTVNIVPETDSSDESGSESGSESESSSESESGTESTIDTNQENETNHHHEPSQESPLIISLNEILNKKPKSQHLNTSFKNKSTTGSRYTMKKREQSI